MPQPLLIKDIKKSFKAKEVLLGAELSLQEGEIFGLVGLNGAGKTTLIKIILGLLQQDGGEALVFGESSKNVKSRRNFFYLPEKFTPSPFLTGREFIDLTLSYHGIKVKFEDVQRISERLGLEAAALSLRVGKYSKGMGQKVGLIAALSSGLPLLILDEPMSGLDPKARAMLKDLLMEYRAGGKTVFFSSHILSDLEEICDRIGVITGGKLVFTGEASEFVGKFGAPNLERAFLAAVG